MTVNQTRLIGNKELARKFLRMADIGTQTELVQSIKGDANDLKKEVKQEIRSKLKKHTGNLLRGVSAQKNKYARKNFPSYVVRMDFRKASHAYLVEYGHGGPHPAPAHPYFRPVIYRKADGINRRIKRRAFDVLGRLARK